MTDTLENPEIIESDERARFMIAEKIIPGIQIKDYDKLIDFSFNFQAKCTTFLNYLVKIRSIQ